jgi:hypothetical protein
MLALVRRPFSQHGCDSSNRKGTIRHMSKAEILAELPKLRPEELAEVQAKLDELAGEVWLDDGDLSDQDKTALDAALANYQNNPDAGSPWEEVKARIQAKLRQ